MTQTYAPAYTAQRNWFGRAEDFLDEKGKAAWIAAMVVGFIVFWPVGLALLAYMIWSKRMFKSSSFAKRTSHRSMTSRSTGNAAFDAYKADTLARLEEEQTNFEAFLTRLREAKDKAEFDEFMAERSTKRNDAQTA
jgi:hypothetical protein